MAVVFALTIFWSIQYLKAQNSSGVTQIFVSSSSLNCANVCDGSFNSPYSSILDAFILEGGKAAKESGGLGLLRVFLVGESSSIFDDTIDKFKDLLVDGILPVRITAWSEVSVFPAACIGLSNSACQGTHTLRIKTRRFYFKVTGKFTLNNLVVLGNDMNLNSTEEKLRDCYYKETDCCWQEQKDSFIASICSRKNFAALPAKKRYGLFNLETGIESSLAFGLFNCRIEYLIAASENGGDYFSTFLYFMSNIGNNAGVFINIENLVVKEFFAYEGFALIDGAASLSFSIRNAVMSLASFNKTLDADRKTSLFNFKNTVSLNRLFFSELELTTSREFESFLSLNQIECFTGWKVALKNITITDSRFFFFINHLNLFRPLIILSGIYLTQTSIHRMLSPMDSSTLLIRDFVVEGLVFSGDYFLFEYDNLIIFSNVSISKAIESNDAKNSSALLNKNNSFIRLGHQNSIFIEHLLFEENTSLLKSSLNNSFVFCTCLFRDLILLDLNFIEFGLGDFIIMSDTIFYSLRTNLSLLIWVKNHSSVRFTKLQMTFVGTFFDPSPSAFGTAWILINSNSTILVQELFVENCFNKNKEHILFFLNERTHLKISRMLFLNSIVKAMKMIDVNNLIVLDEVLLYEIAFLSEISRIGGLLISFEYFNFLVQVSERIKNVIQVSNSRFFNLKFGESGGIISSIIGGMEIYFDKVTASQIGEGDGIIVYFGDLTNLIMRNCTLSHFNAAGSFFFFLFKDNLTIVDCIFKNIFPSSEKHYLLTSIFRSKYGELQLNISRSKFEYLKNFFTQGGEGFLMSLIADYNNVFLIDCIFQNISAAGFTILSIKKSYIYIINCQFRDVLYTYDPSLEAANDSINAVFFSSFILVTQSNLTMENSSVSSEDSPADTIFMTLYFTSNSTMKNNTFYNIQFIAQRIFFQKNSLFKANRDNRFYFYQNLITNVTKTVDEGGLLVIFEYKSNQLWVRQCVFTNLISPGQGTIIYSTIIENLMALYNTKISYINLTDPGKDMSMHSTGCLFVVIDESDFYVYSMNIEMSYIWSLKALLFYCNSCRETLLYDITLKHFRLGGDYGVVFAVAIDFNMSLIYCNIQNGSIFGNSGFLVLHRRGNYIPGIYMNFTETLNIFRCLFAKIYTTGKGGILDVETEGESQVLKIFILNSTIVNVTVLAGGFLRARIKLAGTIMNTNFQNLRASNEAGFALAYKYTNLTVYNCSFTLVQAGISGGLVWSHDETIFDIKNCSFSNFSSRIGGFIILKKSCKLQLVDCRFSNFFTTGAGAFLVSESSNFFLIQNSFIANGTAGGSPGMFELKENNVFNMIDSSVFNISISQNKDGKFLGVMLGDFLINVYLLKNVLFNSVQITKFPILQQPVLFSISSGNATFYNVSFSKLSGFIFTLDEHSTLLATKVQIKGDFFLFARMTKCVAFLYDVYARNQAHYLNKNPDENVLSSFISLKDSTITAKLCYFVEVLSEDGFGVIVLDYGSQVFLSDSIFILNRARNGGALHFSEGDHALFSTSPLINVNNCKFLFNTAQNGGSIFLNTSAKFNRAIGVKKSFFAGNKALRGGAIYFSYSAGLKIEDCTFKYNRALGLKEVQGFSSLSGQGGVLFASFFQSDEPQYQLTRNSFAYNKADIGGVVFSPADVLNISRENNFSLNKGVYYGDINATSVRAIELSSSFLTKYFLRENSNNENSILFRTVIGPIKPGINYSDCLVEIIPFDYYGQKAYRNDEQFAKFFDDANKMNKFFNRDSEQGIYCLSGVFEGQSIPVTKEALNIQLSIPSKGRSLDKDNHFQNKYDIEVSIVFQDCQIGEILTTSKVCMPCELSQYSLVQTFNDFSATCIDCASSDIFNCFGGSQLTPKLGYWRFNADSSNFLKCPQKLACLGDPRSKSNRNEYKEIYAQGLCAKGYTGVMCTECESGFGAVDKYLCSSCSDFWYYAKVAGSLILHLFFIVLTVHKTLQVCFTISGLERINQADNLKNNQKSFLLKVFTNHVHALSILASFPFEIPVELDSILNIGVSSSLELSQGLTFECLLKKGKRKVISLVYFKLMVTAIYPFCLLFLAIVYIKFKLAKNSGLRRLSKLTPIKAAFYIVMMLSYIDILQVNLKLLKCENVGDKVTADLRLISDYGVQCWTDEHYSWIYKLSLPMTIFFLILLPLRILIRLIIPNFSKIEKRKLQTNKDILFKYGAFYYCYEGRYLYWEFVIILRKILLILTSVFFFNVPNSLYPILMVFLIFFLALILQRTYNPYDRRKFAVINEAEEKSLLALVFTTFVAVYYMNSRQHENFSHLLSREVDRYSTVTDMVFRIFLLVIIVAANAFFFVPWFKNYFKMQLLESVNIIKKVRTILRATFKDKKKTNRFSAAKRQTVSDEISKETLDPESLVFAEYLLIDNYHCHCRKNTQTDVLLSEEIGTDTDEASNAHLSHSINKSLRTMRPERQNPDCTENPIKIEMRHECLSLKDCFPHQTYPPFYLKHCVSFSPANSQGGAEGLCCKQIRIEKDFSRARSICYLALKGLRIHCDIFRFDSEVYNDITSSNAQESKNNILFNNMPISINNKLIL